ncbi:MAG: Acyl-CoA dehydrogenase [Syntrophorhabdaceae bacterium PtaU1.Bin034]|nr:MAG: Acyl-CoA dehydrogenase [Syntrophorhabdaceae bacterium PtaU1.Bin034]
MDFRFTDDQKFFKDQISQALRRLALPHAEEIDRHDSFPLALFKELGALGYYGIRYPAEIGGMGADCVTFTILAEEVAKISIGLAATITMQCLMGTDFIYRFGTEEQKQHCLIPAIKGEKIGTIAFTEPDCGSDLGATKTRAIKDGHTYIITGRKMWITNAPIADFVTVAATVDPEKRLDGLCFFLIEKGTPGFSIGQKIPKMSARGSQTAEVILDECRIPKDNLLGIEGKGAKHLNDILSEIRTMIAALGLGLSKAAFSAGLKYAKEREAFGRSIGNFQLIQEKIAEMEMRIKASEFLTYHAAWLKDNGILTGKEAAMAKLYSTETACFVVDEVTRIHGAYGLAEEYPAQRYFRDARFLLFGGGTSEILKTIIARDTLRKPDHRYE